jgi:hypothetical protein
MYMYSTMSEQAWIQSMGDINAVKFVGVRSWAYARIRIVVSDKRDWSPEPWTNRKNIKPADKERPCTGQERHATEYTPLFHPRQQNSPCQHNDLDIKASSTSSTGVLYCPVSEQHGPGTVHPAG